MGGFTRVVVTGAGWYFFFFQAEDGIRDLTVTGVQTCALPIWRWAGARLPEHMVPGQWLLLDMLPRGDHGKVDLAALQRIDPRAAGGLPGQPRRSEERRVGKEGRSRWSPYH